GFGNRAGPGFGTGASYYAITAGLNWKPYTWLVVRPEVRYDWADLSAPPGTSEPFDGGTDEEQLLFATDFVLTF
ncbi:MAG: outer membrane beta-barrel protein, partial [Gammaproteobacteria bacterium]